jgi:hypothetical protein
VICPVLAAPGLAPGASETCTGDASHVVDAADLAAGEVVDSSTATGTDARQDVSPPSDLSTSTIPVVAGSVGTTSSPPTSTGATPTTTGVTPSSGASGATPSSATAATTVSSAPDELSSINTDLGRSRPMRLGNGYLVGEFGPALSMGGLGVVVLLLRRRQRRYGSVEVNLAPTGIASRRKKIFEALVLSMVIVVVAGVIGIGLTTSKGAISGARQQNPTEAIHSAPRVDQTGPATPTVSNIGSSGSSLIIPALRTKAPLVATGAVGQPGAASLTVPSDVGEVGWWDGTVNGRTKTVEPAPKPGQPGVAIIAGHVDSAVAGTGALYGLKNLKIGDAVQIVGSDGRVSEWTVEAKPEMTRKTALPASLFVTSGPPRLALITCGGTFDAATGHYLDNVIVWAAPSGVELSNVGVGTGGVGRT